MTKLTAKKGKRNILKTFNEQLDEFRKVIRESAMFQALVEQINALEISINMIRCLAIGSFTDDFPARYQLALLLELYSALSTEENRVTVSIYDPVFTDEDKAFISKMGDSWLIEETKPHLKEDANHILYFLPHAPLDLTENILINGRPQFWLANNIIQHVDRYTKLQLHENYPQLSKLVSLLESSNADMNGTSQRLKNDANSNDGFSTVLSKKKRKNNKLRLKQVEIDYNSIDSYFSSCKVLTDFDNGRLLRDKPWINAFSDLTFHLIE